LLPLRAGRVPGETKEASALTFGGNLEELIMAWTTPEICEVCVGMEVTAYASAEI
jgi:coenzyme PQQ precursor peptide PqqA